MGERCIGVGVRLKIGDKFPAVCLCGNSLFGIGDLVSDRQCRICCKFSGATLTAKSAAADGIGAITVGAGHTAA